LSLESQVWGYRKVWYARRPYRQRGPHDKLYNCRFVHPFRDEYLILYGTQHNFSLQRSCYLHRVDHGTLGMYKRHLELILDRGQLILEEWGSHIVRGVGQQCYWKKRRGKHDNQPPYSYPTWCQIYRCAGWPVAEGHRPKLHQQEDKAAIQKKELIIGFFA
ncbi:MAG: hypothetical protein P8X46_07535, partial [Nitrospirales bacterium]